MARVGHPHYCSTGLTHTLIGPFTIFTYHEQCSPLPALTTAGAHCQGSRGARQREGFFKSPAGRQGARDGPEGVK